MRKCLEKKILLDGSVRTFDCELILLSDIFGILKYVLNKSYKVGSLNLKPEYVTYAFYWKERPYTLYKWFDKNGTEVGNYFNLSDSVYLTENIITWRDLVIDILITQSGEVEILDEDELPDSIDIELKSYIENSRKDILYNYSEVIRQTTNFIQKYL